MALRIARSTVLTGLLATTAILIAGCGSGSSGGRPAAPPQAGPNIAFRMTTIAGPVASVDGTTATVTTASGPTQVSFLSTTEFRQTSPATNSAIQVGNCISAVIDRGSATQSVTTPHVKASSVTIIGTTTCPASPPAGEPTPGPGSAAPDLSGGGSANPPGAPVGPVGPGLRGPTGTVTSIEDSSFVISPTGLTSGDPLTITTTDATTFATQSAASASDVTEGECVLVFGRLPGTIVDAISVTVSAPIDGSCPTAPGTDS